LFSKLDLVLPGGNYYIHARDTRQQVGREGGVRGKGEGEVGGGGRGDMVDSVFPPTPQLSHHVIICSQLHS
jgi:hypothetical protein